ncbi:hypothetical protein C8Q80DRAFT_1118274 [Daedaleopsis nitida]|nr:hypothetical protein C8Q80DRAFT_1118274 [Daedaleopsis nitida]
MPDTLLNQIVDREWHWAGIPAWVVGTLYNQRRSGRYSSIHLSALHPPYSLKICHEWPTEVTAPHHSSHSDTDVDSSMHINVPQSKILDENKKISIALMLDSHLEHLTRAQTRSEHVIAIDPHFSLTQLQNPEKDFMSVKEVSHHVCVVQALTLGGKPGKTYWELQWQNKAKSIQTVVPDSELPNLTEKNINGIHPIQPGCFVIVKNLARMYIGEILNLYTNYGVSFSVLSVVQNELDADTYTQDEGLKDKDYEGSDQSDDEVEDGDHYVPNFS